MRQTPGSHLGVWVNIGADKKRSPLGEDAELCLGRRVSVRPEGRPGRGG